MARCLSAAALLAVLVAVPAAVAQPGVAPSTPQGGARKPPARVEEEEERPRPGKAVTKEAEEKDKASLEDLLAEALKNNPDIRVADAKVQEAEAVLNRTRLTVMQKVVTFYTNRKAAQAKVEEAERRLATLARLRQLQGKNAVSQGDVQLAEQALRTAKAELELVEADMPSLLGKPPQKLTGQAIELNKAVEAARLADLYRLRTQLAQVQGQVQLGQPAPGTVAEKVRKALDTPITANFFQDTRFSDVVQYLQDKAGIVIHDQMARYAGAVDDSTITLKFQQPLPLRAVLQAIEDEFLGLENPPRFVVREYGLLVVPRTAAPPGAIFADQLGAADSGGSKHPEKPKDKQ